MGGFSLIEVSKVRKISLTLIFFSLFTCAYYNTFYHAEKHFKNARKIDQSTESDAPNPKAFGEYDNAIKKASKILTFHSKSKWVDDALFMIGQCFYYKGEYLKAERKFKELIVGFPKSDLVEDCHYFLGLCYQKLEDPLKAKKQFSQILADPQKKKHKMDALFMLGEVFFQDGEYDSAIVQYQRLLKEGAEKNISVKAQFRIGECCFLNHEYEKAKDAFSEIEKLDPDQESLFKSKFKIGECFYLLKNYQKGLDDFLNLSKKEEYYKYLADLKLKIAQGYLFLDKIEEATDEYKKITVEYPKTDWSAEAFFQLGLIYQTKIYDLSKAKEMFDLCSKEKQGTTLAKRALEKSADIAKLEEYRAELSKEETERSVKTLFLLAEVYLTQMNQPDSALAEYLLLAEKYPESEYAPKSLYAASWIFSHLKNDTTEAQKLHRRILKEYPKSDYAKLASQLSESFPDTLEYPEDIYLEAERLLFEEGKIDSALSLLKKITEKYPESAYAAKSQYALAWIIENFKNTGDSSAIFAYQEVIEKNPDSEYAEFAKIRLGLKRQKKEPEAPPATQPDTTDTTEAEAPSAFEAGIPFAPTPIKRGLFIYPEEIIDQNIRTKVRFKIKIEMDGKVSDTQILNPSGYYDIDDAATQAALSTEFSPDSIEVILLPGWFLYDVEVKPPEQIDHLLDQTD